jgi:hypothetical protein
MRSLVAPLYLIVSVVLSYFAALGLTVLVFVKIAGQPGLTFILPFLLFVFLLALGEDYNVLVMTRIREECHHLPLRDAVGRALNVTGTTVTSAGLVLAGTFGVLAVVGAHSAGSQNVRTIVNVGVGLALGVLMDTFGVRTLLVPSAVVLIGRWNWWPSRLSRALPPGEREDSLSGSTRARLSRSPSRLGYPAHRHVGGSVGAFALDVRVLLAHPLLPLGAHGFPVPLHAAPQSFLARRLDPYTVSKIWPERLPGSRYPFQDQKVRRSDLPPLPELPRFPVIALIPGRLVRRQGLEDLLDQARPPVKRIIPAGKVVGRDYRRVSQGGRKAGRQRAFAGAAWPVNGNDARDHPVRRCRSLDLTDDFSD